MSDQDTLDGQPEQEPSSDAAGDADTLEPEAKEPAGAPEEAEAAAEPPAEEGGGMPMRRFLAYLSGIAGLVLGLMTGAEMASDRGPQSLAYAMYIVALGLLLAAILLLWGRTPPEPEGSPLPPPEGKPFLDELVCSRCGTDVSNAPECPSCGHRGRMTKRRYQRTEK
jgi:DNA-directed RNA polymerase subunit RPC12/RpoP